MLRTAITHQRNLVHLDVNRLLGHLIAAIECATNSIHSFYPPERQTSAEAVWEDVNSVHSRPLFSQAENVRSDGGKIEFTSFGERVFKDSPRHQSGR
jgi:hypothetical protein